MQPRHFLPNAAIALAIAITPGCSDSSAPPASAAVIEVTTSTTGASADMDPDGYIVSVDSRGARAIDDNAVLSFEGLPNGTYRVALNGLAPKCVLEGPNERDVEVAAQTGAAARVMVLFTVSCKSEPPTPDPWGY